ncbi:MAG: acyl-CoA synthetase [Pseudomonadales bacterium]|nr:acyl-CoA synthetase [Pseudomonadales bacterium]MCP5356559.1 AMP-binding protein [Pseudomonadales bacterium]
MDTTTNLRPFPAINFSNERIALQEGVSQWSYAKLRERIEHCACGLLGKQTDLKEERVAFFMPASVDYVTTLLGIWRAGGIAVPLNVAAALPEIEHALNTAKVTRLVVSITSPAESLAGLFALCRGMNIQVLNVSELLTCKIQMLPELSIDRRAMMLFTSGTTNKPKGVVSTHKNIRAQITTLLEAWNWMPEDSIPLFLPLHHIHGIINVLCCALWIGARVTLYQRFEMDTILRGVEDRDYTVFMAVPTIYVKLVSQLEALPEAPRKRVCDGFRAMRLNVSGSAACPAKLFNQWKALTGQSLLERYGMTEIGMAISNPYFGERRAGAVGVPLPGVQVALFDEAGHIIEGDDTPGEIRVRGDNVFQEYWQNPKATAESFVDGWFCTGDVAVRETGYYRIMGRSSVDIIKSGGYKLSALEIESTLLTLEKVAECAVVGVEDETWGEAVTAFVVLKPEQTLGYAELKAWCEPRMSPYKIPKVLRVMEALPRNAMGKVLKPALKTL